MKVYTQGVKCSQHVATRLVELSMAIHRKVKHRTKKKQKRSLRLNSAETGILMTRGVERLLIHF